MKIEDTVWAVQGTGSGIWCADVHDFIRTLNEADIPIEARHSEQGIIYRVFGESKQSELPLMIPLKQLDIPDFRVTHYLLRGRIDPNLYQPGRPKESFQVLLKDYFDGVLCALTFEGRQHVRELADRAKEVFGKMCGLPLQNGKNYLELSELENPGMVMQDIVRGRISESRIKF